MPVDIFNREVTLGGAYSYDAMTLTFPALATVGGRGDGVGMLTQGIAIRYQQPISMIFELGTERFYYVGGRPQGQLQIQRMAGPIAVQRAFLLKYGDVCAENDIELGMTLGCETGQQARANVAKAPLAVAWRMSYCVITQYEVRATAQDTMISEDLLIQFAALSLGDQGESDKKDDPAAPGEEEDKDSGSEPQPAGAAPAGAAPAGEPAPESAPAEPPPAEPPPAEPPPAMDGDVLPPFYDEIEFGFY